MRATCPSVWSRILLPEEEVTGTFYRRRTERRQETPASVEFGPLAADTRRRFGRDP